MENIIKAGTTELTEKEALDIYQSGKYVVNYSGVYQPHYSTAQKAVYFSKVCNKKGLSSRGRFYIFDASYINKLLGYELLNT
jgi:hypothetical protein